MATLTAAAVQQIMDSALKTGDVTDWIAPFFQTVTGANAARTALNMYPVNGMTERQKVGIIRCASASSTWVAAGTPGADANNVTVLQGVLGRIGGSAQAALPGGIQAGGNLVGALAAAIS